MTIYQVQNEMNDTIDEYQHHDLAIRFSEDMTVWFPEHRYHIEALVFAPELQETQYSDEE